MSLACSSAACCLRHPKACLSNFEGTNVDLRAPPHITFVAFEGKDRGVIGELALSAFFATFTAFRAQCMSSPIRPSWQRGFEKRICRRERI